MILTALSIAGLAAILVGLSLGERARQHCARDHRAEVRTTGAWTD